jgi:hypothetical protein
MRIAVAGFALALGFAPLSGCSRHPGISGECTGSIRFHGVVYVADSRSSQATPQGRVLGPGEVVDCDHRTVVGSVVVSALIRVDNGLAIAVRRGPWHGVYVAEGVPPKQWPPVLRRR